MRAPTDRPPPPTCSLRHCAQEHRSCNWWVRAQTRPGPARSLVFGHTRAVARDGYLVRSEISLGAISLFRNRVSRRRNRFELSRLDADWRDHKALWGLPL